MHIRAVPLLAALLPFFAVQFTYLVAAGHGLVDWCNPYIDSCSSISAAGRKPACSMLMNHWGVARKMMGVLWRQQWG